jgi:ferredoxin-NADP reductase
MTFTATLASRRPVATNTIEITLTVAAGFEFTAGQYLELLITKPRYTDELGNERQFSIASAPAALPNIKIAYRESASAFKKSLAELPLGAELEIKGPSGAFTLFPPEVPTLFIAGGIGITPFLSILETQPERPITLLYANHAPETAAYLPELKKMPIRLIEHYGRLDKEILKTVLTDFTAPPLVYIAGPSGLTAAALVQLTQLGLPRLQLLFEEFTGY